MREKTGTGLQISGVPERSSYIYFNAISFPEPAILGKEPRIAGSGNEIDFNAPSQPHPLGFAAASG
jgi:hypothetical protein